MKFCNHSLMLKIQDDYILITLCGSFEIRIILLSVTIYKPNRMHRNNKSTELHTVKSKFGNLTNLSAKPFAAHLALVDLTLELKINMIICHVKSQDQMSS